jgi:DNA-binding NarL/FixJ family response regulator
VARVLAAVEDLFFGAKILETAQRLQVPLGLVCSADALLAAARADRPALIIFDLNAQSCRPLDTLRRLQAAPDLGDIPTLGFFSHVQHDLKVAAAEAGCDRILPRSAFTATLPEILREHAAP